MIFRTIRAGFGLGLVGLCIMVAEVQALSCGDTILTDTKLKNHLFDCPGDGLIIGAPGITLNLNGKRITGSGDASTVGVAIQGVADVTIRNGTIRNFGTQVFIQNSNGTQVRSMNLRGPGGFGLQVQFSNDVVVKFTRILELRSSGLVLFSSHDFALRNSRITDVGTCSIMSGGSECGGGNGIAAFRSDGVKIRNNLFKRISRSGISLFDSRDGRISGNTVIQTSSRPCNDDFGAITIASVSRRTEVVSNRILANDDFGIGLRFETEDIKIRRNRLRFNRGGVFFSRGATGTRLKNNCISHSDTDIGLEVDQTDDRDIMYAVDARNNFWGARSGPSGDGPLGTSLEGSGEEIIQKAIDEVEVIPFKRHCP